MIAVIIAHVYSVSFAGPNSIALLSSDVLDYLISNLVSIASLYTINSRYLKMEILPILLISQSKFSDARKFTLRYQ